MLRLSAGDTAPALTGEVNADLTGASVAVVITRADDSTFPRACAVVNGPLGAWAAVLEDGDLTVEGIYKTAVVADYSDGGHQTFTEGPLQFYVRE
jgi:hypothetical protein